MPIQKICKNCGNCFSQFNTTQTRCQLCSYNKYAKPQKPLKRMGKQAKQWSEVRAQWFSNHPADNYVCYLCGKYLSIDETTLDHVIPKSNAKNYAHRHDFTNLQPCCWSCNSLKGSKHTTP